MADTVVITGATGGIGLAIARTYLEAGYRVVGNARSRAGLDGMEADLDGFVGVDGDIADPATSERIFAVAIERFGRVRVLVNNAGIFASKPFTEIEPDDVDALVRTNLLGWLWPSRAAARHMVPRRSGHILNITASIALQPLAGVPATVPILVKGGLNAATRALALELAPHGIRVSAVAPGIIDTPMHAPENHDFLRTLQPFARLGTAEEVAAACLYLTRATFTTGVVLPVDGGMTAGRF